MRTDAKTARKIGALYFDENTILEVKQLGGGGSGVGGANGLNARNLVTGEDTGEVIAQQAGQIEQQGEQIDALTAQNTELLAENTQLQTENAELTERLEEAYTPAGPARYGELDNILNSPDVNKAVICARASVNTRYSGPADVLGIASFENNVSTITLQLGTLLARGTFEQPNPAYTIFYPDDATIALSDAFRNCCRLQANIAVGIPGYLQARIIITDIEAFNNASSYSSVFHVTAAAAA